MVKGMLVTRQQLRKDRRTCMVARLKLWPPVFCSGWQQEAEARRSEVRPRRSRRREARRKAKGLSTVSMYPHVVGSRTRMVAATIAAKRRAVPHTDCC